ncbi:hypothetical protein T12_8978 [Trichinella patagoniensis]|uniref:Uncharacterized protein n=1 Tax=Trichinella patagoniensis TaxID=990121 RepID=A0A0V0ZBH4_9BILA|nr:hypothetical protein T12_8978 [Trichinella patagoniensis]
MRHRDSLPDVNVALLCISTTPEHNLDVRENGLRDEELANQLDIFCHMCFGMDRFVNWQLHLRTYNQSGKNKPGLNMTVSNVPIWTYKFGMLLFHHYYREFIANLNMAFLLLAQISIAVARCQTKNSLKNYVISHANSKSGKLGKSEYP